MKYRIEVRVRLYDEAGELAEVWGCETLSRDKGSMRESRHDGAFLLRATADAMSRNDERFVMRPGDAKFEREHATEVH